MKWFVKWGLIGVVGLAVVVALFGNGRKSGQTHKGVATTTRTASTPEPTATETSTPEPTPESTPVPVRVAVTGPLSAHSDNVVLKGTVEPGNAHVRVKGQSVTVRHGHWELPVTLTRHGENTFRVVATRKGFASDSTIAVVTRKLSAAEKAVIRQQKAEHRADRRALQSAESYLATGAFSKQGLYEQLSSSAGEGFTPPEAEYAVDHVHADWNKEAVQAARSYLQTMPMSRAELIQQLSSSAGEGFTYEQALYAVNKVY
jgi:hypothetical protein